MQRILVPVDGSRCAQDAVKHVAKLHKQGGKFEVELLNVQPPILSGQVRRFVTKRMIDDYHRTEGERALKAARRLLDRHGVPYESHIKVGEPAETIADHARKQRCQEIVMGSRGMGSIRNLVLGSVATKVIHLAQVPVTLIK